MSTVGFDDLGTTAPRNSGVRHGRGAGDLPPVAVERLRETIASSLEAPLAMCFHTGATSSSRPALYCLVLTNGATLTLRGDLSTLEAEDCFFSRAAIEASDDTASIGSHAAIADDMLLNGLNDMAGPAALLCAGASTFQFLQPAAAPATTDETTPATTSIRATVAREMVRRYAAVDASKQFVLPDGAVTRGADLGCKRVSFIEPQSWGFVSDGSGSRWAGVVDSIGSKRSVKRGGDKPAHTPRSFDDTFGPMNSHPHHANGNGNRISLTNSSASLNEATGNMPRPMPYKPAAADSAAADPAARPASDRLLPTDQPSDKRQNGAARADLTSATARWEQLAAYRAVVALGECRVFGFTEGQADAETVGSALVLPADLALAAAARLDERLTRWTADAEDLRDRLQSAGGVAAEDLRLGLLESRMEAWAAYLTLDSSYNAALDTADPDADRLSHALDSILTRVEAFDEALQLCEPCLAISDETPLLANWRKMLADAYRDPPPWWLERTPALAVPQ
jgi:hypothetical protein